MAVEKFKECLSKLGDHIFVSFDIDSIISADCPVSTRFWQHLVFVGLLFDTYHIQGVSAPANVGLTAQEAFDICFIAGKTPQASRCEHITRAQHGTNSIS